MRTLVSLAFVGMLGSAAFAQGAEKWVTSWAASVQGPYPIGNPSVQPNQSFHFPAAATGARDQSFRLIVRPDIWSRQVRLRLSNAFGTKPVTFDGAFVGLQLGAAAVMPGTNQPVRFGGQDSVTVKPGEWVWSDPVSLPFVREPPELSGRKLAISFHVAGESGPMTWHAKALQTSYVTAPAGPHPARASRESALLAGEDAVTAKDKSMPPISHPGRLLRREIEARSLSANRLALDLGVPSGCITDILNGRRSITADTAVRLGRYFGNGGQFWLGLQSQHDIALIERERGEEIARRVRPAKVA